MSDIQIRNTISTDLARLSALDHSLQTDYVWQLDLRRDPGQVDAIFREVRLPRAVQVTHPRPASDLPDTWHLTPMQTALSGMEPVAYVRFTEKMVPHAVWISDVVVGRDWRRQGLARKLVASAEAWGVQQGLRRAILEMQSKNYPAIRMALKLGYEFCGYNDIHYATRDVALFFTRTI
ncbi:MAG: hypothetical protein CO094_00580 [Anaerolineae bacterium CG_4_9_14_3_um_filter_57_17]|nr:GNAT family N-acetyltransferase [bacterium]NCT20823.1 GNAT family N-acetyltransferase [bacterium]OIO84170.1 MAG: hypothetical protein AUK01_10425 [Anaerolineae bacterium CG2_30_57_67]PJB68680.1 MAG: hypothetical protein CO094_00580 [Anaerolineae bacterium CG_4_9_14_3_um_filter_57_17]